MNEVQIVIKERMSARGPFDSKKKVSKEHIQQILDAARWSPTAHNMQNFDIVVVEDPEVIDVIGEVKFGISETFLRENYEQLSFSKEELQKKKTGILGTMFPPAWVNPAQMAQVAHRAALMPLAQFIQGSPCLLIVIYDPFKRAPASEGDVLGFMSLGCVLENIWLTAQSLGISMQIISSLAAPLVEVQLKKVLSIPDSLRIAYGCRLGYPFGSSKYLRVRREVADFVHYNRYGNTAK